MSIAKRDCRERAAIDRLAARTGAPITEKMRVLGDRVVRGSLDRRDPRANQPALDIARQVEREMAGPQCRREISRAGWVMREKLLRKFRADLVRAAGNARADAGANAGRSAPSASIRSRVASMIPPSAPRQPPCAAPITLATASSNRTGAQSAVRMPSTIPEPPVTKPSARGAASCGQGFSTVTTVVLWTLIAGHQTIGGKAQPLCCNGAVPRNRLSRIARSEPAVQDSKRPPLTPPWRVKKAWRIAGS